MYKEETEEEKHRRLQKEMADKRKAERYWKNKLTEAPEDRMIDPKKRGNRSGVVTK